MAYAIREKIMQNLVTTLEGITTGNGYNNTINAVYRWEQTGNSLVDVPVIELNIAGEDTENSPNPYTTATLSVMIDLFVRHDKSNFSGSTDAYLITFLADITKALMTDNTRGGNAIDTVITGNSPFDIVDGQGFTGLTVIIDILYRYKIYDITQI
ncbi:hypothetical protein J7L67_01910 [bacterium]|nr:hypothetical protein [bacterium]